MAVVMSMSNDSVPNVHPFFVSKNVSSVSTAEGDFHQNDGCRKRQRTASPERSSENHGTSHGYGWADQLRAAASRDSSSFTPNQTPKNLEDQTTRQPRANGSCSVVAKGGGPGTIADVHLAAKRSTVFPKQTRLPDTSNTPESPAASPTKKVLENCPDRKLTSSNDTTQCATTPKKMLRVRPNGKLGSPKANEVRGDTNSKRSRRSAKSQTEVKSLVAFVKYGTDRESRSTIGGRICNILSDKMMKPSLSESNTVVHARPPKATHPFFLGGTARAFTQKSSVSGEDVKKVDAEIGSLPAKREDLDQKESRVTSKPADRDISLAGAPSLRWHTFGSDHARVPRFHGAMEPMWPSQNMLHVGREPESLMTDPSRFQTLNAPNTHRKLKGAEVKIPSEEEVLRPSLDLVQAYRNDETISQRISSRDWHLLRRPLRRLMSGTSLQKAARQRVQSKVYDIDPDYVEHQFNDELGASNTPPLAAHRALQHVYRAISTSLTAFDRFQCETQEWVHKYAPKTAEEVLQPGPEVILLRDWLKGLTTNAVESRKDRSRQSSIARKLGAKAVRRKRKRADVLDDFVISSDEEANQMDEITDVEDNPSTHPGINRSIIRRENMIGSSGTCDRSANAVVISGPHGCGKTATVYAVAQELGFEVFELNSGSRRSGKDIIDKVGDMTRNHLVRYGATHDFAMPKDQSDESELVGDNLKKDIEAGRQGTMNNFFKTKSAAKKLRPDKHAKISEGSPKEEEAPRNSKSQKQSLILLEEVDVLFEEDKMFWNTTLSLISQSRRPVIMTCTDERLLPLDDMILYAILRFASPPAPLATDYLTLIACNEGHLLSREAVGALYKSKGSDLRASISELNFFCQMAIGDTKGGLDWMLINVVADGLPNHNGHSTRVVSENSYQHAMGWLSGESSQSDSKLSLVQECELFSEVWKGWGIDIGAFDGYGSIHARATDEGTSRVSNSEKLRDCDLGADAMSAADTFPACVFREPDMLLLETHIPELADSMRNNYIEGSNVVLADPIMDHSGVKDSIVLTLRACARRLLRHTRHENDNDLLDEQLLFSMIPHIIQERPHRTHSEQASLFSSFEPIARSTNAVLGIPKGPQISSFDGPLSVLSVDLAPYVRSIVSYDLRLEEQRRRLSSLLSGPGKGSNSARTTRSSRAALEGGEKGHTRRERWFPKDTKFNSILQSGGIGWQATLLRFMTETSEDLTGSGLDASRRSSVGSIMEGDI